MRILISLQINYLVLLVFWKKHDIYCVINKLGISKYDIYEYVNTCKMCYCLVCLASGKRDPCVWCGQRTSKRFKQLIHLRLKSIYWACKQSGAAINGNLTKVARNLGAHNDNTRRFNSNAINFSENSNYVGHRGREIMHGGRQRTSGYSPPQPQRRSIRNWIGNKKVEL